MLAGSHGSGRASHACFYWPVCTFGLPAPSICFLSIRRIGWSFHAHRVLFRAVTITSTGSFLSTQLPGGTTGAREQPQGPSLECWAVRGWQMDSAGTVNPVLAEP